MIQPSHDRVVAMRLPEKEQTSGGIFIPDTAKEKPSRGTVVAVGLGRRDRDGKRIPMDVKVGDCVIFGKYAGTELRIDDDDHVVLREEEILAVITS